jgi:hypothetical protein
MSARPSWAALADAVPAAVPISRSSLCAFTAVAKSTIGSMDPATIVGPVLIDIVIHFGASLPLLLPTYRVHEGEHLSARLRMAFARRVLVELAKSVSHVPTG